jgi:outer membrane protein assembly factor BamD (BamD/ComL family)
VLTATDATQYAWEDDQISGESANSLFTRYLVKGLQSGDADLDNDGSITVDELYDYVFAQVVKQTPKQTPGKWTYKEQGEIVIASSPKRLAASEPGKPLVEFDDELEQRLARLYTRGLSAYWLEEWDKAEEVFQAITEIQADYQDAALKLSEVKRQRKLADLYQRALKASETKDWKGAITALQSIQKDTKGYKDVEARLVEAKKQKSLADLYSQAQQLFQAGHWQAVMNVFSKIVVIEDSYPDPESLFAQAQREMEAQNRQKELEGHYNQALRALEAGQWQEAHSALSKVQAIEPNFGETERLLARIEAELAPAVEQAAPVEEAADHPVQVAAPEVAERPFATALKGIPGPANWFRGLKLTRDLTSAEPQPAPAVSEELSASTDSALWSIWILAIGWFFTTSIPLLLGHLLVEMGGPESIWLVSFILVGGLAGLVLWFVLHQMHFALSWKQSTAIIVGWTLAWLPIILSDVDNPGLAGVILLFSLIGLIGGSVMVWVLRQARPSLTIRSLGMIVFGSVLGFAVGGAIMKILLESLAYFYENDIKGFILALSLGNGAAGLLAATAVIGQLGSPNQRMIRWSTVLSGAAGFLVGDLVTNILNPYPDLYGISIYPNLAIIGAIGGASFGLPSRSPRRILWLSGLGLSGLLVGHWLGVTFFEYDILVIACWGVGLGLVLGLSTGSLPGALTLGLVGLIAMTMTVGLANWLPDYELKPFSLTIFTAIGGGLLALGWSYLGGDRGGKKV